MDVSVDDWLIDDITEFSKKVVDTIETLEEDGVLHTHKTDEYFMSVLNKVHQVLYMEAEKRKK
jgi:hypothetical protein